MRLGKYGADPFAVWAQGRAQACAPLIACEFVFEGRLDQCAFGIDPFHVAVETGKVDRTHNPAVLEGLAVAVFVVWLSIAVVAPGVLDERDRTVVGAKRRATQQESGRGAAERSLDAIAPAAVACCVVDFVEYHDAIAAVGGKRSPRRRGLCVGHDDAVHIGCRGTVAG